MKTELTYKKIAIKTAKDGAEIMTYEDEEELSIEIQGPPGMVKSISQSIEDKMRRVKDWQLV